MGQEGKDSGEKSKGQKSLRARSERKFPISALAPNSGVDFVLVTALPEERDAVLNQLSGYQQLSPAWDNIRTYFQADLPVIFPDNSTGNYKIIVTCLLGMGRVQAAAATADAIRRWRPRYILLIGIAGGIATRNIRLGDILISDQVVDYELQKLTPKGPEIRWEVQRADSRLSDACNNYRDETWQELIQVKRPDRGKPRRHSGPIASGDKVIAFGEVLAGYRDVWPKLIGVEMEAAGVATAAFQSSDRPGFFMVRGVSDLADENKSSTNVAKWRSYACAIAASFAIAFLKSGPVPLLEDSIRDKTKQVDIILDGEFNKFTSMRQQAVVDTLARLLRIDPSNIRVLRVYQGSIGIIIEIPDNTANRLYDMAVAHDSGIMNMGIKSITVQGREIVNLTNKPNEFPGTALGHSPSNKEPNNTRTKSIWANALPQISSAGWTNIAQLVIAIIGLMGTVTAAWMGYQSNQLNLIPTPTSISTATIFTITSASTVTQTFTDTPTLSPVPTDTETSMASVTPNVTIEPSPATRVFVVLVANRNTGRPPLHVRFDARDSYLLEPNGIRLSCRGGPCFYTWSVYSGGQQIGTAENNSIGTFEHTFGSNGTYTVTVFVCRGRDKIDCAGSGAQIVVSR